ncbi:hypothetical protein [Mycobacterium sp. PSTR-4-N]
MCHGCSCLPGPLWAAGFSQRPPRRRHLRSEVLESRGDRRATVAR